MTLLLGLLYQLCHILWERACNGLLLRVAFFELQLVVVLVEIDRGESRRR